MTIYIDTDEEYPVFRLRGKDHADVYGVVKREVSPKKIRRWKRIFREYDKMQSELGALRMNRV